MKNEDITKQITRKTKLLLVLSIKNIEIVNHKISLEIFNQRNLMAVLSLL